MVGRSLWKRTREDARVRRGRKELLGERTILEQFLGFFLGIFDIFKFLGLPKISPYGFLGINRQGRICRREARNFRKAKNLKKKIDF